MDKTLWSQKHRTTGVDFRCDADDNSIYLSFSWNGVMVWEYVGSQGQRNAKSFAKFLRAVADRMERSAPGKGEKE